MFHSRSAASVLTYAALTVLSQAPQAANHSFTDDFSLSGAVVSEVPQPETGSNNPLYVAVQNQADHDIQASIASTTVDWTLDQSKNMSAYAFRLGNPAEETPIRVSSATLSDNTFRLSLLKAETEKALAVEFAYVHGTGGARVRATGNTLVVSGKQTPNLEIVDLIETYFDGNDTAAHYAGNRLEADGIGVMNRIVGIEHLSKKNSSVNLLDNAFRISNVESIGWIHGASVTLAEGSSIDALGNRLEISNLAKATSTLAGVLINNGAMSGSNITVAASGNSLTIQNAGTIRSAKAVSIDIGGNSRVEVANNTAEIFGATSTASLYAADIDVGENSFVQAQGNILRAIDLQSANNLYGTLIDASDHAAVTACGNSLLLQNSTLLDSAAQAVYVTLGDEAQVQVDGNTAEFLNVTSSNASLHAASISAGAASAVQARGNVLNVRDAKSRTVLSSVSASVSGEAKIDLADNAVVVSRAELIEAGYAVELNSKLGTSASVTADATSNSLAVYDTTTLGNAAAVSITTDKGAVTAQDNHVLLSDIGQAAGLLEGVSIEARELDAEIQGNAFVAENIGAAARILSVDVRASDKADLAVSNNTTRLSNIKKLDSFAGVYANIGANSTLAVDNNVSSLQNIASGGDLYNVRIKSEAADSLSLSASDNRLILHNVTAQSAYCVHGVASAQIPGSNNSIELSGVNTIGKIDGFDTLILTADRKNNADKAVLTLGDDSASSLLAHTSTTFSDKTIVLKGDLTNTVFMQTTSAGSPVSFENSTVRYESSFVTSEVKVDTLSLSQESALSAQSNKELFEMLEAAKTVTRASETLSQARLADVAFVSQGAEFAADNVMPAASDALRLSDGKTAAFAAMSVGNQHYETGSYVDLSGFHFLGGAALKLDETLLAAFVEYGQASSAQYAGSARGDASHDYVGAGFAIAHSFQGLRLEAALRAGSSSTDFNGRYAAESAGYDANALYLTAHAAGTFEVPITEKLAADFYGRYTFTFLDSVDETLSDAVSRRFESDAVKAHALRVGARLRGRLQENALWRAGLAYEQVFDGKTGGSVERAELAAPAIDGGSGIFEAALRLKPSLNSRWSIDLSVKGYAGVREGAEGGASIVRTF